MARNAGGKIVEGVQASLRIEDVNLNEWWHTVERLEHHAAILAVDAPLGVAANQIDGVQSLRRAIGKGLLAFDENCCGEGRAGDRRDKNQAEVGIGVVVERRGSGLRLLDGQGCHASRQQNSSQEERTLHTGLLGMRRQSTTNRKGLRLETRGVHLD